MHIRRERTIWKPSKPSAENLNWLLFTKRTQDLPHGWRQTPLRLLDCLSSVAKLSPSRRKNKSQKTWNTKMLLEEEKKNSSRKCNCMYVSWKENVNMLWITWRGCRTTEQTRFWRKLCPFCFCSGEVRSFFIYLSNNSCSSYTIYVNTT